MQDPRPSMPSGAYLGEDLIFVISQPRSGSTLLQRLLAGHSWVQTAAETWLMLHPAYALRDHGITAEYNAQWSTKAITEFLEHYADGVETYRVGVRAFARAVYGHVLQKNGKRRFLDKTPRYYFIVPELYELFPGARFLILMRNPLSVLASELSTYIKGDWPLLAYFRPDLTLAPGLLNKARVQLGDAALTVHYEQLVTEPERALERICDYLGLPEEPGLAEYANTPPPKGTMNDPVGIHQYSRPSADSLDKWKSLAEDAQTRHFALAYLDQLGAATVEAMGYDMQELSSTIHDTPVTRKRRRIFPWAIATEPRKDWTLAQKVRAEFFLGAERGGRRAGLRAVFRILSHRLFGGLARLFRMGRANG